MNNMNNSLEILFGNDDMYVRSINIKNNIVSLTNCYCKYEEFIVLNKCDFLKLLCMYRTLKRIELRISNDIIYLTRNPITITENNITLIDYLVSNLENVTTKHDVLYCNGKNLEKYCVTLLSTLPRELINHIKDYL